MCDEKEEKRDNFVEMPDGIIKKGGLNPKPSTPRPVPPAAESSNTQETEQKAEND